MRNTPQGEASEGNPARRGTDDTLMVDQGNPASDMPMSDVREGVAF
jgi:hypothetical protein